MKKIATLLSVSILMLALQSCTKEQLVVYKTINVSLKQNETYQFDLGNLGNDQTATITKQAAHFQTSQMQILNPASNTIYTYVPSTDYAGTDEVEVTISDAQQSNQNQCGFGGSGCNHNGGNQSGNAIASCGQDDKIIYTVHFDIGNNPGEGKFTASIYPRF